MLRYEDFQHRKWALHRTMKLRQSLCLRPLKRVSTQAKEASSTELTTCLWRKDATSMQSACKEVPQHRKDFSATTSEKETSDRWKRLIDQFTTVRKSGGYLISKGVLNTVFPDAYYTEIGKAACFSCCRKRRAIQSNNAKKFFQFPKRLKRRKKYRKKKKSKKEIF